MKLQDWILFETDDLVALNKPSGLLSIPDRIGKDVSLKKLLQEKYNQIFTVHRIDKDTSGLIIFAKNEVAHKHFSQQFVPHESSESGRQIEKIYLGLVIGSPANPKGSIDAPIMEHPTKKGLMVINAKGKEALTDYEVLESFGIYSWLRFRIYTGRTHQIRIHMKEIGYPVACDDLYGDGKPVLLSSFKKKFKLSKKEEEERPILPRLGLHAYQLKIEDLSGKLLELEAPVPKDLRATLQQLEKLKKK